MRDNPVGEMTREDERLYASSRPIARLRRTADLSTLPEIVEADLFTVAEAARAVHVSEKAIRAAIADKTLPAFTIGGRDPKHSGRGLGYRIKRADLRNWFFNVEPDR